MNAAVAKSPPLKDLDDCRQLPAWVRELVLERLDAGFREGMFTMDCEQYAGILLCICPDEFEIPPPPPEPTDTPPGSGGRTVHVSQRVEVYMQRCQRGLQLWHKLDAKADDGKRGIRPVVVGHRSADREGGTTDVKTAGWQEESHLGNPTAELSEESRFKKRRAGLKNDRKRRARKKTQVSKSV